LAPPTNSITASYAQRGYLVREVLSVVYPKKYFLKYVPIFLANDYLNNT